MAITFEVKNIKWGGKFKGRTTAYASIPVSVNLISACSTNEQIITAVLSELSAGFGCPIEKVDSVNIAK